MTKTVMAEYVAAERMLKLDQALEGVEDGARVAVAIATPADLRQGPRPWSHLENSLSAEAGREVAAAIKEAFGRDEIEV